MQVQTFMQNQQSFFQKCAGSYIFPAYKSQSLQSDTRLFIQMQFSILLSSKREGFHMHILLSGQLQILPV
jgi:hypothetical protein